MCVAIYTRFFLHSHANEKAWVRGYVTTMSACECPSPGKCSATGDSSVLLCAMLKWWPLTLRCSGWPVSPTYCRPHLLQVIKQIILEDLQEAVNFILNFWPVLWLVNLSVAINIGHILQPAALHGRLPGTHSEWHSEMLKPWDPYDSSDVNRLLRGEAEMYPVAAPRSVVLESAAWWSIEKIIKLGCMWPPARCIGADLSWLGCDCKQFCFDIASARWMS